MVGRVALTVGSRLALTLLSLISSIVTARVLGESGRGDYFFMVTLSATIVQFANVGLPTSGTYYVAQRSELAPRLLANAFWVSIIAAGGIGIGIAAAAHTLGMLQDTPVSYLLLAAALAPPSLFFMIVANILAGLERFVSFNVIEAGSRGLAVAAIVAAGAVGAGAGGFVTAAVVAWIAASVAVAVSVLRGFRPRIRFDRALFATGLRYSAKAYVITLLSFLVLRANIFLLRREYGPADLGLYSVAAQLSDVISIVPQAVAIVLFPRLVRDSKDRWSATVRASILTAGVMVLACGVTALVAAPGIRLLYGAAFVPSATVLRIMLPGVVCFGVIGVVSQYLGAEGIPRIVVAVWLAAAALVAALSLALVPSHAGAGAAAALSATYGVTLIAVVLVALRHHRSAGERDGSALPLHFDVEEVPPAGE